ncbi:uncharacterized protein LOC125045105 [Penaeus chinensis]|uniref:uncharacterized protein LOC125045105 n=1 Tax=Penaeus chinensis TaxID=139456 RepID=UPI001FB8598B|nr:uncharacterized protein LOC125045105 [Penaeus chinensis]
MEISVATLALLMVLCFSVPAVVGGCCLVYIVLRKHNQAQPVRPCSSPSPNDVASPEPLLERHEGTTVLPSPQRTPFGSSRRMTTDLKASFGSTSSSLGRVMDGVSLGTALEGVILLHSHLEELRLQKAFMESFVRSGGMGHCSDVSRPFNASLRDFPTSPTTLGPSVVLPWSHSIADVHKSSSETVLNASGPDNLRFWPVSSSCKSLYRASSTRSGGDGLPFWNSSSTCTSTPVKSLGSGMNELPLL